ncbi:MAG: desulfoferrodoxin [Elusimicrobiota bacterium]|jgi:superoxide reductase|nr:desulfoferrodoxin [Elusimicrobiota bacterium]
MTKKNEIYKCVECGNIIEVYQEGEGELACHNKPMRLLAANTSDGAQEKHVPVIEKSAEGWLVKIGSVPHPMLPEHYIEFIEIMTDDGKVGRKYLKPGDKPEALFTCKAEIISAREYCNIHGLWATK